VIDADGLLNINAHGNMNGFLARGSDGEPIDVGDLLSEYVSSSNMGLSRSEINLALGLTADPDPTAAPRQLRDDNPSVNPDANDAQELADAQFQHEGNFGSAIATTTVPLEPAVLSNLE